MTTAQETERKYEGRAGRALLGLDGLPRVAATSGPQEQVLRADYYDSDDLRYPQRDHPPAAPRRHYVRLAPEAAAGRRHPAGDQAATRPGWPAGPEELARLVRVYTRGRELRPVAKINTRRQVLTLVDAAGDSLAEIAADDISAETLGAATEISQWNEVEVELTGGDRGLLRDADVWLRRDGLRPSARTAKLARALACPAGRARAAGHRQRPPCTSPQPGPRARSCWLTCGRRWPGCRRSIRWSAATSPTRCTRCG